MSGPKGERRTDSEDFSPLRDRPGTSFQIRKSALPSIPTQTSSVACCGNRVDHSVTISQSNSSPTSCMQTGLCRMRTESLAVALTARRETDFGRQRLGCQNKRYRHLSVRQRRHVRYLNRENARTLRVIRQRLGNAGSYRSAWWRMQSASNRSHRDKFPSIRERIGNSVESRGW
jgi:hypothetical protein